MSAEPRPEVVTALVDALADLDRAALLVAALSFEVSPPPTDEERAMAVAIAERRTAQSAAEYDTTERGPAE